MPVRWTRKRPCIAVTGPDRGGYLAWICSRMAIARAGGQALRMQPGTSTAQLEFDGLIIGGGADVDPGLYGMQMEPAPAPGSTTNRLRWLAGALLYPLLWLARRLFSSKHYSGLDAARDELEYRLLEQALQQHKPVLGIWRGAQLINVYLGGSLHQDISGFYIETPASWSVRPVKSIRVEPGSRLHRILGTDTCRVNALHRQSIDRLGTGLRVAARETNGVIQAIEHDRHDCLLGVQWHPEYLFHHARQQYLFRYLVAEARRTPDPNSGE